MRRYWQIVAVTVLSGLSTVSCDGSPTEPPVLLANLPGRWQLSIAANTPCSPQAVARTISMRMQPVTMSDTVLSVDGLWDFGAPTTIGWGLSGTFRRSTRAAELLFTQSSPSQAMRFTGTIVDGVTLRGRIGPPPAGYESIIVANGCEQEALARRTGD